MEAKKYILRYVLCFYCALLSFNTLSAQNTSAPLQLYDPVPDMELRMINHTSDKVKISDFKGKLLILDFWSVWCSVCVAQFPKIEQLQAKFSDQVIILPVGFEFTDWDNIEKFYADRTSVGKPVNLPSAIQSAKTDTLLRSLFPFRSVPMLVWIDATGRLVGITSHLALNEQQINVYLEEQRRIEQIERRAAIQE